MTAASPPLRTTPALPGSYTGAYESRRELASIVIPNLAMWAMVAVASWRPSLALTAAYFGILGAGVLIRPVNGIVSLVAIHFAPLASLGISRPFLYSFALAMLVGGLRIALARRLTPHVRTLLLVGSFVAFAFASVAYTPSLSTGLEYVGHLLNAFGLLVAAVVFLRPSQLKTFAITIALIAALACGLGFVHGLFRDSMALSYLAADETKFRHLHGSIVLGERMIWAGVDPNYWAMQLFLPVGLTYSLLSASQSRLQRALWSCTLVMLIAGTLGTFSRSAFLVLCATGLAFIMLRPSTRTLLGTTVLSLVGAIVIATIPSLQDRLASIPGDLRTSGGSERLPLWDLALQDFTDSPLFGGGIGYFVEKHGIAAHNTYIGILTDLGAIGLFLFVAILGRAALLLVSVRRHAKRTGAHTERLLAEGVLIGFLGTCLFAGSVSAQTPSSLWLPVGLASALAAWKRLKREPS